MDLLKVYERRVLKGVRGDDIADLWMKYSVEGTMWDDHLMQAGISEITFKDGSCCLPLSFGDKQLN